MIPHTSPLRFSAHTVHHGSNRDVRWIITQGHVDLFENTTKPVAEKLDKQLVEAGFDLSPESKNLKMTVFWPHDYISLATPEDSIKTSVVAKLKELGATQNKSGSFQYQGAEVKVRTYAEIEYDRNLPISFFKKQLVKIAKKLKLIK
ncbi:MAG: hypothetical protein K2X66_04665 [Cyanobacteria bacterium]|nr:hypothetical protein [Cyanobacteriota bacterium]